MMCLGLLILSYTHKHKGLALNIYDVLFCFDASKGAQISCSPLVLPSAPCNINVFFTCFSISMVSSD